MPSSQSRLMVSGALACLLGSGVGSCKPSGESPRTDGGPVVRDSAGIVVVESGDPRWSPEAAWQLDSAPILSIGGVDGPWEEQFGYVRDALLVEGTLVVSEGISGEVRYYDLQGQHLATIGRLGEGPGEFSPAAAMQLCQLPGGSVAVTDDARSRFHIAAPERRFVSTVSLPRVMGRPLLPRDCLSDGSWLVQGETHQTRDGQATFSRHSIHIVDAKGQVTGEILRLNGNAMWWNPTLQDDVLLPFAARDQVLASGFDVVVLRASEGQIEWRTREGRLTRIARRVGLSRATTADEIDERAFYDQGLPLAEFVPLYQGALADPHGNVWAHRYRIPEETAGQYDVFDGEGAWLGTVAMLQSLTVYDIGSDYVVGMTRGSLDVQTVEMYRIVKPREGR